jgi:hypothetical protein
MSGLLAHALKQHISLPVERLLLSVRAASQLSKLRTGRGLEDGLQRRGERFFSAPGTGSRLP